MSGSAPKRLIPRVAGCWFLAAVLGIAGVTVLAGIGADHGRLATQLWLAVYVMVPTAGAIWGGVVFESRRAYRSERTQPAPAAARFGSGAPFVAAGLVLGLICGGVLAAQIGLAGTRASSGVIAEIGGVLCGVGAGSLLAGLWTISYERRKGRSFWVQPPRVRGRGERSVIYYRA